MNHSGGAEFIAEFVKQLPNRPGVYQMLDADANVLYVGKANNLKNRVSSYVRVQNVSQRIALMISKTVAMEFTVTNSEIEALLLEASLIKKLKPRFNVLLRDDKSFPFIIITDHSSAPGIYKYRGARNQKGDYFGPFASAGAVTSTINTLQRVFLLRTCKDSFFKSRTRPCLLYQIKRCSAPCTGEITETAYRASVAQAKNFLAGKSHQIKDQIAHLMQEASDRLDYEQAALYRDRLVALTHTQAHQNIHPHTVRDADVFALYQEAGLVSIQVVFFRNFQNWGTHSFFPKADPDLSGEQILTAFLPQFYHNKPVPKLILLSCFIDDHPLLTELLSLQAGEKIQILTPKRGEKKNLVDHALTNAKEALKKLLLERTSQEKFLQNISDLFELKHKAKRIEVYDNSHLSGTNPVGCMIVAGSNGFIKNQYRKFNIDTSRLAPGDDYAMMRQVIERRFSRLLAENEGNQQRSEFQEDDFFPKFPDILLIDGGKGQINVVNSVLREMNLAHSITVIGIAKGIDRNAGRERFFIEGKPPFSLPMNDPTLHFIQRLRDEAHRFAISSHRQKRKKAMINSPLDEIIGIGRERKRALLNHFGSSKEVASASIADLMQVKGISQNMAKLIHAYFHNC